MSYKLFLNILLILTIIATACICVLKPQMHKCVLVYNSEYTFTPQQQIITEQNTLPAMPAKQPKEAVQQQQNVISAQVVNSEPQVIHIYKNSNTKPEIDIQQTNKNFSVKKIVQPQTPKTQKINKTEKINFNIDVKQIAQRTADNTLKNQTIIPSQNKVTPVPSAPSTRIQYIPPKPQNVVSNNTPVKKVLTSQEEDILWNKWRSNLQNSIMRDVKLPPIPTGTVFRFTFNVDKYGKITKVQTWSDTPKFTPYAIQYIAPVIRSYQGRSILNFPSGSNRTSTLVKGGWKISPNAKFSTPQDYNDTERIVK